MNTILNIMGLLGVPKLQIMYTLAKRVHGNVPGNVEVSRERGHEHGWKRTLEHGSVNVNFFVKMGTCMKSIGNV